MRGLLKMLTVLFIAGAILGAGSSYVSADLVAVVNPVMEISSDPITIVDTYSNDPITIVDTFSTDPVTIVDSYSKDPITIVD